MSKPPPGVHRDVPLAPRTTLGVGGPAAFFAEASDLSSVQEALDWAAREGLPVFILGGGSNILLSDRGWPGLVLCYRDERCSFEPAGDEMLVRVGAGADWDSFVAETVARGLAGLECTSGIPGYVGGAPIQNVGAYGQEISESFAGLRMLDLESGEELRCSRDDCGFAYRDSRFKGDWAERYLVLEVLFKLRVNGPPALRYPALQRIAAERLDGPPGLRDVRELVLELRRSKSMVLDPTDPNSRSAGSFFTNPVLSPASLAELEDQLRARSIDPAALPRYDGGAGRSKVPAAWLIEQAGFRKGETLGSAGISTRHSLALINRGGASAEEIVALASKLRRGVREAFGIRLDPEPRFVGFDRSISELLDDGA